MSTHVPLIHQRKLVIGLVHGNRWAFRQNIEIGIGDQCGDLNNAIALGIEPVISRSIQIRLFSSALMLFSTLLA